MDASHSSGGQSRAALKRKKKHKNKAKQQQQPSCAPATRALDPKREKKRAKLEAKAARAERRAADPEAPDGAVLGVTGAAVGGRDADVTRVERGARTTLTRDGEPVDAAWAKRRSRRRARPRPVPADSNERVHALCRCLEDEFGSTVGANSYLTPGGAAQGFAAHWDDVDVFVLQTEGSKTWQIFAPDADDLKLPRVSSQDFDDEALDALYGTLRAEVTLDPGDVLYLPRGFVHRAATGAAPSLHVTLAATAASAKRSRDHALPGVATPGDDGDDDDEPADDDDDGDDDDGGDDDDDGSVAEVAAVAYDAAAADARALRAGRGVVAVYAANRRDARLCLAPDGRVLLYHARANAVQHRARPVACLEFEADDARRRAPRDAPGARAVSSLPHDGGDDDRVGVASALVAEGLVVAENHRGGDDSGDSDDSEDE
ncbi:histone demethylase [Aureococcus anophagefferens]|nr:histone demethylase [Aureococcus anophagefferens]